MKTVERKYLLPFILVTSLFLLWGLANNMTDTLLAAFKRIMNMSDTQTSLIQFAFYGSYFCFALPAALFIRKKSYKSGIILGLLVAGGILSTLAALTVVLTAGTGWVMVTALILISAFMSLMFPKIYGIAMGGIVQPDHPGDSKIAASALIMAILGGALLTPLQGMLSDATNIHISYLIPIICFAVVTAYALYANNK